MILPLAVMFLSVVLLGVSAGVCLSRIARIEPSTRHSTRPHVGQGGCPQCRGTGTPRGCVVCGKDVPL